MVPECQLLILNIKMLSITWIQTKTLKNSIFCLLFKILLIMIMQKIKYSVYNNLEGKYVILSSLLPSLSDTILLWKCWPCVHLLIFSTAPNKLQLLKNILFIKNIILYIVPTKNILIKIPNAIKYSPFFCMVIQDRILGN